jgi:hypothetical protein
VVSDVDGEHVPKRSRSEDHDDPVSVDDGEDTSEAATPLKTRAALDRKVWIDEGSVQILEVDDAVAINRADDDDEEMELDNTTDASKFATGTAQAFHLVQQNELHPSLPILIRKLHPGPNSRKVQSHKVYDIKVCLFNRQALTHCTFVHLMNIVPNK